MSLPFIRSRPIDMPPLRALLDHPGCGAIATFEGVVRNHHEGLAVAGLTYEAHATLAESEWQRLCSDAQDRFDLKSVAGAHRVGSLAVGGLAVWIGVSCAHRKGAFEGCAWLIERIKHDLPIWKHELYADGAARWRHDAAPVLPTGS